VVAIDHCQVQRHIVCLLKKLLRTLCSICLCLRADQGWVLLGLRLAGALVPVLKLFNSPSTLSSVMITRGNPLITYRSGNDGRPGNINEILIGSFLSRKWIAGVGKEKEATSLISEITSVDSSI
jgi:hypothetical protein